MLIIGFLSLNRTGHFFHKHQYWIRKLYTFENRLLKHREQIITLFENELLVNEL